MEKPIAEEPLAPRGRASRRSVAVLVSVIAHLVFIAPFVLTLPLPTHEAPQEEVVSVEMVPPPEPEPEQKEEPKPPPEEAKQEPPPPEPPPPQQQPPSAPIPTLRPVFRFGEESRGPEQKADGNSATEQEKAPDQPEPAPEQAKPEPPKPEVSPQQAEQLQAAAEEAAKTPQTPAMPPAPTTPPVPETSAPTKPDDSMPAPVEEAVPPPDDAGDRAMAVLTAPDTGDAGLPPTEPDDTAVTLPVRVAKPAPRPTPPAPSTASAADRPVPALKEVKRLYSASSTGDRQAMTAMAGIAFGDRAGQLCASELQAQLLNGSPAFVPELVPSYILNEGSRALNVRRGAFRANGVWYDVSFRCSVNQDATEIDSFSYAIGEAVPRGEWRQRGFPNF